MDSSQDSIESFLRLLFDSTYVSPRQQYVLLQDPVLIYGQDAKYYTTECCRSMGIELYSLDLRLLHHYPAKTAYTGLASTEHCLSSSIISNIIDMRPCIVYIDSFDMIFHDPAQQHSSTQDDSLENTFFISFQAFLRDLYNHMNEIWEKEHESPMKEGESRVNQNSIAVVVGTSQLNKFNSKWSALFPTKLKTVYKLNFFLLFEDKDLIDAERVLLEEYIHTHKLSQQHAEIFIQDYKILKLSNQNINIWMDLLENTRLKTQDSPVNSSVHMTTQRVKNTLSQLTHHVPYWNGYDTVNGIEKDASSGGHQQGAISSVHWEDIGGLDRVRREIFDVLELPFRHPELFRSGCPRRQGVLLYGPPGTGKTLVAKAVATECGMAFLSVKGPELLDMYVGESEKNVREVFQRARAAAPCVLFFDEIDSLAPARAKGNNSGGGVMDRMVSQLLTEIDLVVSSNADAVAAGHTANTGGGGIGGRDGSGVRDQNAMNTSSNSSSNSGTAKVEGKFVFIIAATNRPDLLDPALMRPGRFDRKIYLGVCKILTAQTRKFALEADVDLRCVAQALPDNVTGADIGAVSTTAYGFAMERKLQQLRQQAEENICRTRVGQNPHISTVQAEPSDQDVQSYVNHLPEQDLEVRVVQADFLAAAAAVQPSVVDLDYYESLDEAYNDATVEA